MKEVKTPSYVVQMSILLAFFFSINIIYISFTPPSDEGIDSGGVLGLLYAANAFLIFVISGLSGHMRLKNISYYSIFLAILLIILYRYTDTHIGPPRTPILGFLCYTIVSFLLPNFVTIDVKLLLKSMMIFSLPLLFRVGAILFTSINMTGSLSLGYSYMFLPPVLVSIVYMHYYYKSETKDERVVSMICFIANIFYAFFIIAYGSRGPVLAILALIVIMRLVKIDPKKKEKKIAKGKVFFVIIFIVVIISSFIPILTFLKSVLNSFDINIVFIDHFLEMEARGDVTSGRNILYLMTTEAIAQRPYFGYGIDQFENNLNEVYPHNFFLQLLYDGGIFLTSVVLIPVIYKLIKKLKDCSYNEFVVIIVLFFASVPGGLLSGDLWTMSLLWAFFGAALSKNFVYQRQ